MLLSAGQERGTEVARKLSIHLTNDLADYYAVCAFSL